MNHIPKYIEQRIRQAPPLDSFIVPGSTPVISFGNSLEAGVATLGINPSRVEFLDRNGTELTEKNRRLSTLHSLGYTDLSVAPKSAIEQVFDDCNLYFSKNPYTKWFKPLEKLLNAVGKSYFDGSACHLDLVQWATDPTWANLKPASIRKELVEADSLFLQDQLSNENIKLLLVNGRGVMTEVERYFHFKFKEIEPICGFGRNPTRMYTAEINGQISVIAWSTNLQSSFGVSNALQKELAGRIAKYTINCIGKDL